MIAITMGDATGVGPEICARFFAARPDAPAFVIGDAGVMERARRLVPDCPPLCVARKLDDVSAMRGLRVLQVAALPDALAPGQVDARAGKAAYDAILTAIDLALEGRIDAMVTAPIHKEALYAAGIRHPGHTEILAERTGTAQFGMMLTSPQLRVVLVSIHVPLIEAIRLVTRERVLAAIRLADEGTRAFGIDTPRLAVAGLNPHAGEGGLFGREEIEIIGPAVADARGLGFNVSGPHAPDTVFMRARAGEFDAVVAQYHDQGLIPVKYLGIEGGVNITVGLPIIRTSVDHGTAFDIAWKGIADAGSLIAAYDAAVTLVDNRRKQQSAAGGLRR